MQLGPHTLRNNVFVAPMAGVTDRPFRQLCKRLGAGYAVSEMAASNPALWASVKTSRRLDHHGEIEPRAVQIAGGDPAVMAEATRFNISRGAQVIDINMGCPAKKVCNVQAGSALMSDPSLAMRIVEAVVEAAIQEDHQVPVTLKMRTGPDTARFNAPQIARAAEQIGIKMLTIHGRSRACAYIGAVDYQAIANIKSEVRIPVVANGDITSGAKAAWVLRTTGADAVMIGRAAQGRPWIFQQIVHYLEHGVESAAPLLAQLQPLLLEHLHEHHTFHGIHSGVRTARKHVAWYLRGMQASHHLPSPEDFLQSFYQLESPEAQHASLNQWFEQMQSIDRKPGAANDASYLETQQA